MEPMELYAVERNSQQWEDKRNSLLAEEKKRIKTGGNHDQEN